MLGGVELLPRRVGDDLPLLADLALAGTCGSGLEGKEYPIIYRYTDATHDVHVLSGRGGC